MNIETKVEGKRGCGYRKGGGLYLVSDGLGRACGKLPIPLSVCPTCHGGIKPTRSWTWIDGDALIANRQCNSEDPRGGPSDCELCPLASSIGRVGLLWIGGKFYERPGQFTEEAQRMGVSRRIPAVPKDFKLGETRVMLAHRECIPIVPLTVGDLSEEDREPQYAPGIFHVFLPQRIEYVVKGDEPEDKLARLVERGITPVKVEREVQLEVPI